MTTIAVLLLAVFQDKPAATEVAIRKESYSHSIWTLRGTGRLPENRRVVVSAVRLERRWENRAGRFAETRSHTDVLVGTARVDGKRFRVRFRAGVPGFYHITISEGEATLHEQRMYLGDAVRALGLEKNRLDELRVISKKAAVFYEELEAVMSGQVKATARRGMDYRRRLTVVEKKLLTLKGATDFSATAAHLTQVYFNLRNVQVWPSSESSPEAENDALDEGEGAFAGFSTREEVRSAISSSERILDAETLAVVATVALEHLPLAESGTSRLSTAKRVIGKAIPLLQSDTRQAAGPLDFLAEHSSRTGTNADRTREKLESFLETIVSRAEGRKGKQ